MVSDFYPRKKIDVDKITLTGKFGKLKAFRLIWLFLKLHIVRYYFKILLIIINFATH